MGLLDTYVYSLTNISGYYKRTLNALDPDLTTQYPNTVTGTPTPNQNPGGAPQNFDPQYDSSNTYLTNNPIAGVSSGELSNTLPITNLDTTEPGVNGGIPYNQILDPTIYPPTTNHTSPIKGWFAQPSSVSSKFYQYYSENNTYVDFISSYT